MALRYILFCVLLFYNANARVIEVACPSYCVCDMINDYRRATCQSKNLVTVEIDISPLVEYLDLSHNHVSDLNRHIFLDLQLTELKLLNLSYNKISQIDIYAFEGLEQLKILDLSYNMIQYFLEQWWLNLNNLRELYLRGNNLASINNQPPISLPELKVLDLSDNKVENFHTIVFENVPDVETLDISDNYLINIRAELIQPLTNLRLLVAKGISLNCQDRTTLLLLQYIKKNNITYVGSCKGKETEYMGTVAPKFERMMVLNEANTEKEKLGVVNVVPRSSNSKPNPQNTENKDGTKNKYKTAWKQWEISKDITDKASKNKKYLNGVNAAKNSWPVNDKKLQKVGTLATNKPPPIKCVGQPNPDYIKIHSIGSFFKYIAAKISLSSPGGAAVLSGVCGFIIGVYAGQTKKGQAVTRRIKVILKKISPFLSKMVPGAPFFHNTIDNPNNNDDQGGGKKSKKKQKNKEKTKKKKKQNIEDDEEHLTEDLDKNDDDGEDGAPAARRDESVDAKWKFKRGTSYSIDDRTHLLEEEELQDGSTPAMKKKIRSFPEYRDKRDQADSEIKKSIPKDEVRRKKKFIWEQESEEEESDDSEEVIEKLKSRSSLSGPSLRSARQPDTDAEELSESGDSSPQITKEDEEKPTD